MLVPVKEAMLVSVQCFIEPFKLCNSLGFLISEYDKKFGLQGAPSAKTQHAVIALHIQMLLSMVTHRT